MKKTAYIFTAMFTFLLSVGIYFVFLSIEVDKTKPLVEINRLSTLPFISLCEATRNTELYENKDFRLKVDLFGRDNLGYGITEKNGNCDSTSATLRFDLVKESKEETDKFLKEFSDQSKDGTITFVEVELVGKLVDWHKLGVRPFAGRFSVKAKEIKQISPIKQFTMDEWYVGKLGCKKIKNSEFYNCP